MGWQKRSTGKVYDSLSGHTYIIGALAGNIIRFIVKSKTYSKCKTAKRLGIDVEDHECQINWDGPSEAMDA